MSRIQPKNTAFHYRAQKHLRTVWFDSSHGIHEKTLQHKLECFWCTCGNLPRAKKQSTGLFFVLRRTALFDSSLGIHEKTLQHKLECFLVTRAGIEPTLTA